MRSGEILALKTSDIDFKNKVILSKELLLKMLMQKP